jgi:hypothetical protein
MKLKVILCEPTFSFSWEFRQPEGNPFIHNESSAALHEKECQRPGIRLQAACVCPL